MHLPELIKNYPISAADIAAELGMTPQAFGSYVSRERYPERYKSYKRLTKPMAERIRVAAKAVALRNSNKLMELTMELQVSGIIPVEL